MLPNEYCPMGSPSLLNGDFFENIARLKDFSWSFFLSSDSRPKITTATVGNGEPSKYKSFPISVQLAILTTTVCTIAIVAIIKKLPSNVKITRDRLVKAGCVVLFGYIVSAFSLFNSRIYPDTAGVVIPMVSLVAVAHTATICGAVRSVARNTLWPSQKEPFYKYRYAGETFLILSVLLFLFCPVHRPNVCPPIEERIMSEYYFIMSFMAAWIGAYGVNHLHCYCAAEEYDILKDKKYIGKLVKKEGFGWIEYMNADENDEQTNIKIV
ncbi:unnamed protein product [Caenorhabditis brenneri]